MTKRKIIVETVESEKPIDFRALANSLAEILMKERLKNVGRTNRKDFKKALGKDERILHGESGRVQKNQKLK